MIKKGLNIYTMYTYILILWFIFTLFLKNRRLLLTAISFLCPFNIWYNNNQFIVVVTICRDNYVTKYRAKGQCKKGFLGLIFSSDKMG